MIPIAVNATEDSRRVSATLYNPIGTRRPQSAETPAATGKPITASHPRRSLERMSVSTTSVRRSRAEEIEEIARRRRWCLEDYPEAIAKHKATTARDGYLHEFGGDTLEYCAAVLADPDADAGDRYAALALETNREYLEADAEAFAAEQMLDVYDQTSAAIARLDSIDRRTPPMPRCTRRRRSGMTRQSRRSHRTARRTTPKALGDPDGEPARRSSSAPAPAIGGVS